MYIYIYICTSYVRMRVSVLLFWACARGSRHIHSLFSHVHAHILAGNIIFIPLCMYICIVTKEKYHFTQASMNSCTHTCMKCHIHS